MITRAFDALKRGELLQEFIPVPQELKDTVAGFLGNDDEQALLEAQMKSNREKYGHANWYDFCVNEWGTKWDVGGDDGLMQKLDDNTLQASFDSAWAPPTQAYEKLIEQGFHIKAYYNEPGMGFCGVWEGDTEQGFDDDYCEYGGETSETVREAIGEELDDYYGISEQMAEYEDEENQEE
jgi:hypothetical protein